MPPPTDPPPAAATPPATPPAAPAAEAPPPPAPAPPTTNAAATANTKGPAKGAAKGPATATAPRGGQDVEAWLRHVAAMNSQGSRVDWSSFDWSKLQAKDVGVRFGPVMTEAEFREYRRRQQQHQRK